MGFRFFPPLLKPFLFFRSNSPHKPAANQMCKFIPIFKPSHFYVYFILKHLKSTSGCAHLKKKITFVSEYQYKRPANKMLLNNKRFELFFNTYYEPVYLFSLKYVREEPCSSGYSSECFCPFIREERKFLRHRKSQIFRLYDCTQPLS